MINCRTVLFFFALSVSGVTGAFGQITDSADMGNGGSIPYDTSVIYSTTWDRISGRPATATRWPAWSEVTGRPSTFPTTWGQVSGKPSYYPTRWSDVANKPSDFTPSAHTHDERYLRLSGGTLTGDLKIANSTLHFTSEGKFGFNVVNP